MTQTLKAYSAGSFVSTTGVKYYNGSSWVAATGMKRYNGSSWDDITITAVVDFPDPSPLFSSSPVAEVGGTNPANKYYKSTYFYSTDGNWTFTASIPAISVSMFGYVGLGIYDQTTDTAIAGVERAHYAGYGQLIWRTMIAYAYGVLTANTACSLKAQKSGSTVTFSFYNQVGTLMGTNDFTLTAGHKYRLYLYDTKDTSNWNGNVSWTQV